MSGQRLCSRTSSMTFNIQQFCSQAEASKDLEARVIKAEQERDAERVASFEAHRAKKAAEQSLAKAEEEEENLASRCVPYKVRCKEVKDERQEIVAISK